MDKFALIYEFNKESPLIVYEAAKELEKKNFEKSLELFEKASYKFPFHPTVFFLKAVAFAYTGQFDLAGESLIKGDNLLGDKSTLEYYHRQIENVRLNQDNLNIDLFDLDNEQYSSEIADVDFDNIDSSQLISDEEFNFSKNKFDTEPIITETLAEIYASQGNYFESLEIFEKLKNIKPELSNKFEARIREIKSIIENKNTN